MGFGESDCGVYAPVSLGKHHMEKLPGTKRGGQVYK